MNVLYQPLPDEINGYKVNFDFQIGIQLSLVLQDMGLSERERWTIAVWLLFGNDDGTYKDHPRDDKELKALINGYLGGWNKDNTPKEKQRRRVMDFDIDQWRIYADFRLNYGINLNEADLHFWEFQALLWNMPRERSSFLQAVEIRSKKLNSKMSQAEKQAILKAKEVFALKEPEEPLSEEEQRNVDEFKKSLELGRIKRSIAKDFKK